MNSRAVLVTLTLILVIIGGYFGTRWYQEFSNPVTSDIKKQLYFPALIPQDYKSFHYDKSTLKYDSKNKILSFIYKGDSNQITFTEQATPDSFVDVPDVYSKLVQKMNSYQTFDTPNGKVDITRPTEQKSGQTAVNNHGGTLIFAVSNQDLIEDEWRFIFNNLEVAK